MKGVRIRNRIAPLTSGAARRGAAASDHDKEFDTIDDENSFHASLTPPFDSSPAVKRSNIER
jgi:hypothetical protein